MAVAEELAHTHPPVSPETPSPAVRNLWRAAFSFPAMIAVGLCLMTLFTLRGRFDDPDLWWHLKVGETLWRTQSLPRFDEFSYTTGHHSWLPHEWLAEASIYAAYKLGGYTGMWVWLFGLASLLFLSVYALCSLYCGNLKVALLGALTAWFFGTVGLAVRPLLLGHFFLVVELLLLQLARSRGLAWLWGLPPLFAVWVNCHGSYLLGLLVLGVAAACSFVDLRLGRVYSERTGKPERQRLCLTLLLCPLALMVNPIGPRLLAYPLNLLFKQSDNLGNVSEWRAADITDPRGVGLFALAAGLVLIFLLRRVDVRMEELLLLGLGFGMGLQHIRLVFAFGILAAPVLCRLLGDAWDRYEPDRDKPAANAALITVSIALMVAAFPRQQALVRHVQEHSPVAAVEFIRRSRLSGPMLNDYEWGGYLIWALPEQKVFIDGRADIFDWTGVFREYGRWATLEEDPSKLLDKYKVRYCLLHKSAPMTLVLPYLPGWQKVYSDEIAVIFARS